MGEMRKLTESQSTSLDFIRAFASQAVVVGHAQSYFGVASSLRPPHVPWIQNWAVVLFFILSGFLISYSVHNKRNDENYGIAHYLADRFSRIYCAFVPAILFVIAIDLWSIKIDRNAYQYIEALDVKTLIGNLMMLQGPFIDPIGSARPFWTLAVEWWIYVFYGFFVLVCVGRKKTTLIVPTLLLLTLVIPTYNFVGGRGDGLSIYWIFGSCAFIAWNKGLFDSGVTKHDFAAVIFLLGLGFLRAYLIQDYYDAIVAFSFSAAMLYFLRAIENVKMKSITHESIKFFASYSFTLYLVHYSILDLLHSHFLDSVNSFVLFAVGILLSNICAIFLGLSFETGFTKNTKKWIYKNLKKRNIR